jgi:hypothetical protein
LRIDREHAKPESLVALDISLQFDISTAANAGELSAPETLRTLASLAEGAEPASAAILIARCAPLVENCLAHLAPETSADSARVKALIGAGAAESAVIALMPPGAVYTGGKLGNGSVIAQVVVVPDCGAHSRTASCLALAWLAALLRSLAQGLETSAA